MEYIALVQELKISILVTATKRNEEHGSPFTPSTLPSSSLSSQTITLAITRTARLYKD